MKIKLLITLFLAFNYSSFSRNSNEFHAQVELVQPLVVKVERDLNFGNIVSGTSNNEIQKGKVLLTGEKNKQIKLTIRIKNERTNRRSGDALYLNHEKSRRQIFSNIYYNNISGSSIIWKGSSYSLVSFNDKGEINIVFNGTIKPKENSLPGKYSKTLEIVARYD